MRISDWSSDVCSSDLPWRPPDLTARHGRAVGSWWVRVFRASRALRRQCAIAGSSALERASIRRSHIYLTAIVPTVEIRTSVDRQRRGPTPGYRRTSCGIECTRLPSSTLERARILEKSGLVSELAAAHAHLLNASCLPAREFPRRISTFEGGILR